MACVGCGAAILLASVIPFIRIVIKGVASRDVVLVTEFHKSALLIVAAALALGFVGVIGLVRRGDPILVAIAFAASAVVALTAVPVAGHLTSGVICGRSCIGPIAAPAFEDLEAEVRLTGGEEVYATEMRAGLALALLASLPLYLWSAFAFLHAWTRRAWIGAVGGALAAFVALALFVLSGFSYLA